MLVRALLEHLPLHGDLVEADDDEEVEDGEGDDGQEAQQRLRHPQVRAEQDVLADGVVGLDQVLAAAPVVGGVAVQGESLGGYSVVA